jgi:hypothetical protein
MNAESSIYLGFWDHPERCGGVVQVKLPRDSNVAAVDAATLRR